jgi:uncharacterized membrane protein YagU involved in acid resistance
MKNPFHKLENKRDYQLFNLKAALWAGFVSGLIFFASVCLLVPATHPEITAPLLIRWFASILLGASVLTPATFTPFSLGAGLLANLLLSIVFTCLLAFIVHKWGLWASLATGLAMGLCLYVINFYSMSYFFPWFWAMNTPSMLASHLIFGTLAGALYEYFERPFAQ